MLRYILFLVLIFHYSYSFSIEHFLMPKDAHKAEYSIIESINKAKSSIKVAMFMFTNKKFAKALLKKSNHSNIKILIILDYSYNITHKKKSKLKLLLKQKGINVYIVKGLKKKKNKFGILHSKLMIIDDSIVYIGSANWTKSAFKYNYEILIKLNDLTTAKLYNFYFYGILKHSSIYNKGLNQ